jgi:hypothetical protein
LVLILSQAKHVADKAKVADQADFDKAIIEAVKKVPQLERYLKVKFTLRNNQKPHELKF